MQKEQALRISCLILKKKIISYLSKIIILIYIYNKLSFEINVN